MNYQLELRTEQPGSKIVFNAITFDHFKINIIERYTGRMDLHPELIETILKVRTLHDEIIKTKNGNVKIKIKGNDLNEYSLLTKILNSYEYKNRLLNVKEAQNNYVYFVLRMVIHQYDLQ